MIPGGARLHAVYGDRVLLERNGAARDPDAAAHAAEGRPRSPRRRRAACHEPAAHAATTRPCSPGLVRVQPVFNQGKLTGYRIFPGGNHGSSAFTQLGLRAGDLILAVNGTPLDDAGARHGGAADPVLLGQRHGHRDRATASRRKSISILRT